MEKLCIFCVHFRWSKEEMWGMGSTLTGPMFTGGYAECMKGHFENVYPPKDEDDYRKIILRGQSCKDYEQVKV